MPDSVMLINATNQPKGYLASSNTPRADTATSCSWRLASQKGKRLRLTVFDYAVNRQMAPGIDDCQTYVEVVDDHDGSASGHRLTLCSSASSAENSQHADTTKWAMSMSHQVTVRLSHSGLQHDAHYLVMFEGLCTQVYSLHMLHS